MPNWCEGTLRVRGPLKNLKRFVLGSLANVYFEMKRNEGGAVVPTEREVPVRIEEYGGKGMCGFSIDAARTGAGVFGEPRVSEGIWIRGTRRHFIEDSCMEVCAGTWDDVATFCARFKAAWGISAEQLQSLCKRYSVDMRIYAFEQGMEFNRDIEIIGGEITKNLEIEFDDYDWECICPKMGG